MSDDDQPPQTSQRRPQPLPNDTHDVTFRFDSSLAAARLYSVLSEAESSCWMLPEGDEKKFIRLTFSFSDDFPGLARKLLGKWNQPIRDLKCIKVLDLGGFPVRSSLSSNELFSQLYSLETIKFPKNIVGPIGNSFLVDCGNLQHVEFPVESFSGVAQIGHLFCSNCRSLVSVDLAGFRNVTTIGVDFLSRNPQLEKVSSLSELRSLTKIGAKFLAFNPALKKLVFDGSGVSSERVTYIGESFLAFNDALTEAEFNGAFNNVEHLERDFLSHCAALECLTFQNSFLRVKQIFSDGDGRFCAFAGRLKKLAVLPGSFSNCTDLGCDMFADSGGNSSLVHVDLRGFEKLDASSLCVKRDSMTPAKTPPPPLLLGNCSVGASRQDGEGAAAAAAADTSSSSSSDTPPPRRLPVVLLPAALRVVVDENIFKQAKPDLSVEEYCLVNRLEPLQKAAKWSLRKYLLLMRSARVGSNSKIKDAMHIWNVMTTVGLFL